MPHDNLRTPRSEEERASLRDRLAALGELAAGMAHDYNNILGTIILYCEVLLVSRDLTEADRTRVAVIQTQARRGAKLTSQVLDYARRSDFERRPIDLKALLVETKDLLEATFPREIEVDARFDGDRFIVNGDTGRLQQALMNLAINARDSMPEGGRLEFDLERLQVAAGEPPPFRDMSPGDWVRLNVRDTGQGIPPDVMSHVFEPFFTTKPAGKGTGLGLAQVYGIVKRHGGYVDLRSEVGSGTTFILYLPIEDREPDKVKEEPLAAAKPREKQTVLVIESDEWIRQALILALESLGDRVITAATAMEGTQWLVAEHGAVDVVLCDANLPDRDGEELVRQLADSWKGSRFILMSGVSQGWETRQLPSDSRTGWLDKPFTMEDLKRSLQRSGV